MSKKENLKIIVIAIWIGVLTGLIAVGFNQAIEISVDALKPLLIESRYWYFLLPIIGSSVVIVLNKMALYDISYGFGVGQVLVELKNISKQIITPMRLLLDVLASCVTLIFGFTAGRFGPIVHLGASVGSMWSYKMNLNPESIRLLIGCGVSGTIASVFGLPFFAVVFVAEVIFRDAIYKNMAPLLMATFASFSISSMLGFNKPLLPIVGDYSNFIWSKSLGIFVIGLALFIGCVSILYIVSIEVASRQFKRLPNQTLRFFIAAVLVGISAYLLPLQFDVHSSTLNRILSGNLPIGILLAFVVFHTLTTSITLGSGYIGGNFFPGIAIGAGASLLYTKIINRFMVFTIDYEHIGVLGACCMIGCFVNAPISAIALCIELTQSTKFVLPIVLMVALSGSLTQLVLKRDIFTKTVERTMKQFR